MKYSGVSPDAVKKISGNHRGQKNLPSDFRLLTFDFCHLRQVVLQKKARQVITTYLAYLFVSLP